MTSQIFLLTFLGITFLKAQSTVRVEVAVTDKSGLLSGFHKDDFEVSDQGKKQQIVSFSEDDEPLDLVLMFDSSSSTKRIERLLQSSHLALAELRKGDRVAVAEFSGAATLIAPFSGQMDTVEQTLLNNVALKNTVLNKPLSAMDAIAEYFLAEPPAHRRAALIVTTGSFAAFSANAVTRKVWDANVLLSGLLIRATVKSQLLRSPLAAVPGSIVFSSGGTLAIVHLAERTGGEVCGAGSDPGDSFVEAIRRIRLRYSLQYTRPQGKLGEDRTIEIKLIGDARRRNPHARVLARTGYVIPRS